MDLLNLCLTSTNYQYNGKHYKQLHSIACRLLQQKLSCKTSRNKPFLPMRELYLFGYATLTTHSLPYTKTKTTIFMNTLTDRTWTYSFPRRSRKMVKYLFQTAQSLATTTDCEQQFTENTYRPITIDQSSYNPTSHNATTTLTRQVQLDYDLPDSL